MPGAAVQRRRSPDSSAACSLGADAASAACAAASAARCAAFSLYAALSSSLSARHLCMKGKALLQGRFCHSVPARLDGLCGACMLLEERHKCCRMHAVHGAYHSIGCVVVDLQRAWAVAEL